MNEFDIFYLCALIVFFWLGFFKGFLRSLIGPACLAFWSIIGVLNYDLDNNVISAVTITIIGSFTCSLILQFLFFLGKHGVHQQHRHYVFWPSRLLGGVFNAGWNGLLVAIIAITLSLLPNNFLGMEPVQKSIMESLSCQKFYTHVISPFPLIKNIHMTISIFKNQTVLQKYQETPEYQAVFSDPKIDHIMKSPKIMKKLQNKNIISLLIDKEVQAVLKDNYLMMKVSELTKRVYQNQEDN